MTKREHFIDFLTKHDVLDSFKSSLEDKTLEEHLAS